jgi:hypothetical protein
MAIGLLIGLVCGVLLAIFVKYMIGTHRFDNSDTPVGYIIRCDRCLHGAMVSGRSSAPAGWKITCDQCRAHEASNYGGRQ